MAFDENSVAELFYTSGSTGTPKGVMLTHRTLYLHGFSVSTLYKDTSSMVDLHTIPLFHANGWGHPQASTLVGVKQVMVRRFEPSAVLKLIQEHRATDMSLVPTMANALINAPDLDRYDVSSLRTVMIGGAAASPELIARFEAAFHAIACRLWTHRDCTRAYHGSPEEHHRIHVGCGPAEASGHGGMAHSGRGGARGG
jgi:Acyl-CoA synthetases (AMP-forming)/AMP-acid ligases II